MRLAHEVANVGTIRLRAAVGGTAAGGICGHSYSRCRPHQIDLRHAQSDFVPGQAAATARAPTPELRPVPPPGVRGKGNEVNSHHMPESADRLRASVKRRHAVADATHESAQNVASPGDNQRCRTNERKGGESPLEHGAFGCPLEKWALSRCLMRER